VTLEILQTEELAYFNNINTSLGNQNELQERVLFPKIDALLTNSTRLRLTISEALRSESEHIKETLAASLTNFESSWKTSVESTLSTWSSIFVKNFDSTILVQLKELMERARTVVAALTDLERRIETIPQRVDEKAAATLSSVTTSFNDGAFAIGRGVSKLVDEFDRGTEIVAKGFAADLSAAREIFAQEVGQWLNGASREFSGSLRASLDSASSQSAIELRELLTTIRNAASDVQARFEEIAGAYEAFNKQHGRFRAEIKETSITLHEWHEDAVRTEVGLLHDWTTKFVSDLSRLGLELNKLIERAGHEVIAEIKRTGQDREETNAILREVVRGLRNGDARQAHQVTVDNRSAVTDSQTGGPIASTEKSRTRG
jgi:hypothetical protein